MTEPSAVDALMADCRAVVDQIAEHKQAVLDLTARRDVMVAELRRLGLPERAVGRLLGISGPRVNQIMNPAAGGPERGSPPAAPPAVMSGHNGKCIYCEHGPYCTRCAPPGPVPDDAYVCGACREEITRSEIAADPYYRDAAVFGDGA